MKKRSLLQEVATNHVWARMQVRGFRTQIEKSWALKKITISPYSIMKINILLKSLEREIKLSYSNYKSDAKTKRKS